MAYLCDGRSGGWEMLGFVSLLRADNMLFSLLLILLLYFVGDLIAAL